MNAHTNNVQIIQQNGVPAFAVIPYEEYLAMLPKREEADTVPQAVAEKAILEDIPLIKAWRRHRGMTQKEVATKAGISQAALSQMERTEQSKRTATLEKLALALDVSVEQIRD